VPIIYFFFGRNKRVKMAMERIKEENFPA